MSRIHDMGGRFGDGRINFREDNGKVFAKRWHARALAITLAAGALGKWNLDALRHARECLPPKDYARLSYYEKWLAALAGLLVDRGLISKGEIAGIEEAGQMPLCEMALPASAGKSLL